MSGGTRPETSGVNGNFTMGLKLMVHMSCGMRMAMLFSIGLLTNMTNSLCSLYAGFNGGNAIQLVRFYVEKTVL